MHRIQFREIMRDAEVAYAIHPIVRKYLLTVDDTTKAILACGVPRAARCSSDYECLDMTAADLTERKSVAKGGSASAVEAAIPVDNPVSKNN
ncbi:MAG: hypothetical protein DME51_13585 [Verrucomicrobia bacterium]|nr:MAG: hypothetical protein DME51_13585 [Verrucomicrobiota bacterium]